MDSSTGDTFNLDEYISQHSTYVMIGVCIFILIIITLYSRIKYRYGIVMCCYNRPEYLRRTLQSLKESDVRGSIIYIIDDHSTDKETISLINTFTMDSVKVVKIRNKKNLGINYSLLKGFNMIHPKCEYMVNIDSDVLMKKDWLQKLYETYQSTSKYSISNNGYILSGFNCVQSCKTHSIVETYPEFHIKKTTGGVNLFFHRDIYDMFIREVFEKGHEDGRRGILWDWKLCEVSDELNVKIIVSNPSVIQHIGFVGLNSGQFANMDVPVAEDYD